jgi:hypothetical protein
MLHSDAWFTYYEREYDRFDVLIPLAVIDRIVAAADRDRAGQMAAR